MSSILERHESRLRRRSGAAAAASGEPTGRHRPVHATGRRRPLRPAWLPGLVVAGLTALMLTLPIGDGVAAAAASPLTWSAPARIDHGPTISATTGLTAVACPSSALCVAVDGAGNVATSTNPAGGAAAWTVVNVDGGNALTAVACPSPSLCVAVDDAGSVVTSTNPTGGGSAWKVVAADPGYGLRSVACASTSLCIAGDNDGSVITATAPTGGASAWGRTNIDFVDDINGVACPSTSLCVAVDDTGNNSGDLLVSTNPTNRVWQAPVQETDPFSALVCPSTTGCLAVDAGGVFWSTTPGTASSWGQTNLSLSAALTAVACAPAPSGLCVTVDNGGGAESTTDPVGPASGWNDVTAGSAGLTGVSCPATSLCVAVDTGGDVVTTKTPTTGGWTVTPVDGTNPLFSVSCVASPSSLCVAGDNVGQVLTTTNPTGGASTWSTTPLDAGAAIERVSCASAVLCAAVDSDGHALTTTAPTGGASKWRSVTIDGTNPLYGLSCVASPATVCVAVDANGDIFASSFPTSGAAWPMVASGEGDLTAVSCASSSLCVAVDAEGYVITSTTPSVSGSWTAAYVDGNAANQFTAVSCASSPSVFCLATDDSGDAWTSTQPTQPSSWQDSAVELSGLYLWSVSCSSASLCVAVDSGGDTLTATTPAGGPSAWAIVGVEPCDSAESCGSTGSGIPIYAVSCVGSSYCVAADSGGNAVLGVGSQHSAPVVTQQPVNTTFVSGQSLLFTAAATGNPTPTVQWQYSVSGASWVNIPYAVLSTLSGGSVTGFVNGWYVRAVFTNSVGTTDSNPAKITVDTAPSITTQPVNTTFAPGQSLYFTAAATGNPAPTVQWQYSVSGASWVNIAYAVAPTLSGGSVTAFVNGWFVRAVFTNSVGTTDSNAAKITVS